MQAANVHDCRTQNTRRMYYGTAITFFVPLILLWESGLNSPAPRQDLWWSIRNHIVIQCGDSDTFVGLAHLAQRSICVNPGDVVTAGQQLAKIENSGNTSEPHLHIHAKRGGRLDTMLDGDGVAIHFEGKWMVRNSVARARSARDSQLPARK